MKKIIYIFERFFTIRDYHRFGAEYLESKGYEIEIWRVGIEQRPKVKLSVSIGMYQGKNMFDLTWWEFNKRVKKNKHAIYILNEYDSLIYMMMLAKYNCIYFLIRETGKVLYSGTDLPKEKDTTKFQFKNMIMEEFRKWFTQESEKIFKKHLPEYAFLGAEINEKWESFLPVHRKIYIHSYDYDRYLETKTNVELEEKWIVWVDSGFGNIDISGIVCNLYDPWRGRNKIWGKLEAVFDKLEEYYNLPVIVAGHPHTKYKSKYLCKRKIIFNRTPELVAKSKFVIMQWSTTASLALLFRKDILVLIDNDFKKVSNWRMYYSANYKYFGIVPCNMDVEKMAKSPWEYVKKINQETAQKYIDTYLKMPGTPNKLFIEVIEEKIEELENRKVSRDKIQ
ncbi:MAG: hypothetical protein HFH79_03905 [Lachnospiraceae bacterium]|nr:hypothetical protein [Lachnospiraceae bacterium]